MCSACAGASGGRATTFSTTSPGWCCSYWIASTADGKFKRITDFGQRRTFIARRISWSSDAKWIFAAVGEGDADIVQMDVGHCGGILDKV